MCKKNAVYNINFFIVSGDMTYLLKTKIFKNQTELEKSITICKWLSLDDEVIYNMLFNNILLEKSR